MGNQQTVGDAVNASNGLDVQWVWDAGDFPFGQLKADLPACQSRLLKRHAWQEETGATAATMAELDGTLSCLLPVAKEWFLWLADQRVPVEITMQESGLRMRSPVLTVDAYRQQQLPNELVLRGGAGERREGAPLHLEMARRLMYSVALAKGQVRLGKLADAFEEPEFHPVDGAWPPVVVNRLNALREAAEMELRNACPEAPPEAWRGFQAHRVALVRALMALMDRLPDWIAGYKLESTVNSLSLRFHAAPARQAPEEYPMGIELSCREAVRLVWWTRQGGRREAMLACDVGIPTMPDEARDNSPPANQTRQDGSSLLVVLARCVDEMLAESVPDEAVAEADLQAGREVGVPPLTYYRKDDGIRIKVNGVEVVGRFAALDWYEMTVEIVQPYRKMSAQRGLVRPCYPFRGTLWGNRRQEITPMGMQFAQDLLRDAYRQSRELERNIGALKASLAEAKELREFRIASQPKPEEWARRKAEIKARQARGELDARGFSNAMVQLKHERQQIQDRIEQAETYFQQELRRLGLGANEAFVLDVLAGRERLKPGPG